MRHMSPYNNRRDSLWDFMSEVEKAFDQAWAGSSLGSDTSGSGSAITRREAFTPAVDLHETNDFFLISVDLPGVDQKNIKIDVENGRLSVSGERSREDREDNGMFKRFERSYGSFTRSFQLPQNVDDTKIQARYENGVLEIMVPKAEQAKPRSIQVESNSGGLFSKLLGGKKTVEGKKEDSKH